MQSSLARWYQFDTGGEVKVALSCQRIARDAIANGFSAFLHHFHRSLNEYE